MLGYEVIAVENIALRKNVENVRALFRTGWDLNPEVVLTDGFINTPKFKFKNMLSAEIIDQSKDKLSPEEITNKRLKYAAVGLLVLGPIGMLAGASLGGSPENHIHIKLTFENHQMMILEMKLKDAKRIIGKHKKYY